jgi:hypothetical protein
LRFYYHITSYAVTLDLFLITSYTLSYYFNFVTKYVAVGIGSQYSPDWNPQGTLGRGSQEIHGDELHGMKVGSTGLSPGTEKAGEDL